MTWKGIQMFRTGAFRACAGVACCALALNCSNAQADPSFARVTDIFIRSDNAASRGDIFVNSYTGVSRPAGCAAGVWCKVLVTDYGLPEDTKAVFLSGILIITHGVTSETADLKVGLRAAGDTTDPATITPGGVWYNGQSVEAAIGNGQRSTMATWVPVRKGAFEFRWERSTSGQWPTNSSYGVNLTIQAFSR